MTNEEAYNIISEFCFTGYEDNKKPSFKLFGAIHELILDVEENTKLKAEIEQWQSTNLKLVCELTRIECENYQLKADLKKVMPFEFGQKLYSIETWEDTGDCTIFEYTFDGVEASGIRLVYERNKEDVCVFSLDEIGVNIFESMDEAEKVLKGGIE